MKAPKKKSARQVHPAASALLILFVLGGVQAVWWRFLVYREPTRSPGMGGGGMMVGASNVQIQGRADVAVRTQSGNEDPGFADGPGHAARFDRPTGLALDGQGGVYVADTGNNRIRQVSATGDTITVAGGDQGFADGPAMQAKFNSPCGICAGPDQALYVADTGNHCIRKISGGQVTTIAGGPPADGAAEPGVAGLYSAVAYVAAPQPHLVVSDASRSQVREFTLDGAPGPAHSVSGAPIGIFGSPQAVAIPSTGTLMLGPATLKNVVFGAAGEVSAENARKIVVRRPVGVCPLGSGWLVTDSGHGAVLLVADGAAQVVAGYCSSGTPVRALRDGNGASSMFGVVSGIVFDGQRYAYVADTGNNCIRRLDISPLVPR
jgi:hypothetical protein